MSNRSLSEHDLEAIARMIADGGVETRRFIEAHLNHFKETLMSQLDDAIASAESKVAALTAEVTTANAKIDALIALATAGGATQAQLDAIAAIGTTADSGLAALQGEEAKVDAADGASSSSAPVAGSGTSSSAPGAAS